jgi:hypothetical protein
MQEFPGILAEARLWQIVVLSLEVSLSAVAAASLLGLPLGAAIAVGRFPGRHALIVLLNALMGLPPVVVGLMVYLLLSRAGPLGAWGLLFTPSAMVIAQTILIVPIVAALCRQAVEDAWREYEEQLRSLGVEPRQLGAGALTGARMDARAERLVRRSVPHHQHHVRPVVARSDVHLTTHTRACDFLEHRLLRGRRRRCRLFRRRQRLFDDRVRTVRRTRSNCESDARNGA